MRYYAEYENGEVTGFGMGGFSGVTITEEEYHRLEEESDAKCDWEDKVYDNPTAIDLCPPAWRDEILWRVEERRQWEAKAAEQAKQVSDAEFAGMVQEVL